MARRGQLGKRGQIGTNSRVIGQERKILKQAKNASAIIKTLARFMTYS